jgi:hypothetical protein
MKALPDRSWFEHAKHCRADFSIGRAIHGVALRHCMSQCLRWPPLEPCCVRGHKSNMPLQGCSSTAKFTSKLLANILDPHWNTKRAVRPPQEQRQGTNHGMSLVLHLFCQLRCSRHLLWKLWSRESHCCLQVLSSKGVCKIRQGRWQSIPKPYPNWQHAHAT